MAVDELAGKGVRRNSYRERRLRTVIGGFTPRIPRLREGIYFPDEVLGRTRALTAQWSAR